MGDIVHTLPAVAGLRRQFPKAHLAWLAERRWLPLLEGNPDLDETLVLERDSATATLKSAWALRGRFDRVYDFQGLFKSAIPARLAGGFVIGFAEPREKGARALYQKTVNPVSLHVVDRNMELAGASKGPREFRLPSGRREGRLPEAPFVLASPAAGWPAKEWPGERYERLRTMLGAKGIGLVLNGPPGSGCEHESSIAGLIDATRKARAVVGVDSGPLHIAAALGKPGVAIFGPTDPARNGPYGGTIRVLRAANVETTYKREGVSDAAIRAITPEQVMEALAL
jgi:heptosyltransferase-1